MHNTKDMYICILCFPEPCAVLCWFVCLQARTCANYNPITNPGERFECPADTQFNPAAGNKTDPTVSKCCKVTVFMMGVLGEGMRLAAIVAAMQSRKCGGSSIDDQIHTAAAAKSL